jgi:uncharacterized SAM-binding protein YcdF (DUF218 family)
MGVSLLGLACLSPRINLLDRLIAVPDQYRKADVVVAFSSGKLEHCQASPQLFLRENYAAALLRQGYSRSGKLIISGTYTKTSDEAEACRVSLAALFGISPRQIILDNQANTTYDNARDVTALMRQHHWKTAVLVTSRSHMFRAWHALEKQGVTAFPRQVPDYPPMHGAWLDANRINNLGRFLYEYGALLKYKWYGYI